MKTKYAFLAVLVVFLFLSINSVSEGVNTTTINGIRTKGVLEKSDLANIDNFLSDALRELANTSDFTSVAKIRATILSNSKSNEPSARNQYAEQFSISAHKYISDAFDHTKELTSQDRAIKLIVNLLILIDALEDPLLLDMVIDRIDSDIEIIRYWAVHCATNSATTKKLDFANSADARLMIRISGKLEEIIPNSSPEVLALITKFTRDSEQGEKLLLKIADLRISQYANWTVKSELLDNTILELLHNRLFSSDKTNSEIAGRFGQLYAYAMQRYIKGHDILSETQKEQLISVLVQTENTLISKLLAMPQSVIKRTIELDNYNGLLLEYNRLFGDENNMGYLAQKLGFDYGKAADGSKRISPLELCEPIKSETKK